jgi:hypothetical protein
MHVCSVKKITKSYKIRLGNSQISVYSPCNASTGGWCAGERDGEQVAPPAGHTRPSKSQGTVCLIQMFLYREIIHRGITRILPTRSLYLTYNRLLDEF